VRVSDTPSVVSSIAELKPGDMVGPDYRIVKTLGQGGMALVFQIENLTLGTMAAMKVPRVGLDGQLVDRFVTEARAHMTLVGQTHVVAPMQVGKLADDRPFLVMQLVRGVVLDRWLFDPSHRPSDPVQALAMALRFAIQIGLGLDAAHRQKPSIIHRDLKPSNIFVDAEQTVTIASKLVPLVRIGDFGLAWSPGQDTSPMGTPGYVSPEQSMGLEPIPQSDLYSLGAILYELIDLRPPFISDDAVELLMMHRNDLVPPLHNPATRDIPELTELVIQLLAKRPEERPWNAREVVSRLEGILTRLEGRAEVTNVNVNLATFQASRDTDLLPQPVPAKPTLPISSARLEVPPTQSRRRLVLAAFALLVFAGFGLWRLTRTPAAPVGLSDVEPPSLSVTPLEPVAVAPIVDAGAVVELVGSVVELDVEPLAVVASSSPKQITAKRECGTGKWRQAQNRHLQEIETVANALEPAEVERAVQKIGAAVDRASTPQECDSVETNIKLLMTSTHR
jgi:serine/threonine protein kinase